MSSHHHLLQMPMAKGIFVSTVISQHYHLTLLTSNYVIVDFEMAVAILPINTLC